MNKFMLNETSYHGSGAISAIPSEIQSRGFKKVFVASDPDLVKFGVSKKVTDIIEQAGIEYTLYSDIKPNPTIENVQHGVEEFKASGAECIVAIGGGSSMDTSKAIGIIVANPEFADVRSLEGVAQQAQPQRSQLTMSSRMLRKSVSSYVLMHTIFPLLPLLTPI